MTCLPRFQQLFSVVVYPMNRVRVILSHSQVFGAHRVGLFWPEFATNSAISTILFSIFSKFLPIYFAKSKLGFLNRFVSLHNCISEVVYFVILMYLVHKKVCVSVKSAVFVVVNIFECLICIACMHRIFTEMKTSVTCKVRFNRRTFSQQSYKITAHMGS